MNAKVQKLRLKVDDGGIPRFFSILQQGFFVCISPRSSLWEVLESAGFSREYLEEGVQTLFLNGSAVDNIETETVSGGSVIALSAAMPGLVGAIFRKRSPLSSLRSMTRKCNPSGSGLSGGELVRLKLFNTVAEEMGQVILGGGAILKTSEFQGFLIARREVLGSAIVEAELDGEPMDPERLFTESFPGTEYIWVSID